MITATHVVRLYSDANGDSHFEEVEMPMTEIQYSPPAPAIHLSEPIASSQVSWFRFPADWGDAAHPSPRRQLAVFLDGEVEVTTSTGATRIFRTGDCLLMEDTLGAGHGTRPLGGQALGLVLALE
jgi:hypothetical protein